MSDTPEKSGNQQPDKDRRAHPRQRIHSLSYVKIGDGNGGIALNISEGGISVQAAAVLEKGETVPMWLEIPKVRHRVEVQAEIVWLSESRKEAGLRFVDLQESTLRKIRKWMEREASPEKFEDEPEVVEEEEQAPVPAAPTVALIGEDKDVRELTEASVMSAEEIKIFESSRDRAEAARDFGETDEASGESSEGASQKIGDEVFEDETVEIQAETTEAAAEEPETEEELIAAFGPPVVPFERRPHAPFTAMNALAGVPRTANNLAVAPTVPALSLGQVSAAQVAENEPVRRDENVAKGADWKDFRVQLHTGWFLAALVLLLALISFVAGMAVRRGALNQVLGEQQDSLVPKSSPAPVTPRSATSLSGATASGIAATPGKPLWIEIVDLANHRWVIPASNGTNRAGGTVTSDAASRTAEDAQASRAKVNDDSAAAANEAKPKVPLVLNLPETPISASGSVAISAQRAVPVPTDGSAAQSARNLQVGQLLNMVEPVYPPEAIKERVEGTVKLHAVVGSDGSIQSLTALSGPKALVDASMSAVHNWKYSPTRMGGQAIETEEDISFVFRLPN